VSGNESDRKNVIIGTAGHIDHGKTTLISALTGEDTDRLDEEKERGISIDLGFTGLELADDIKAGIIDVPGHEKFVKNMLAGAGGVDIALLVVAADEGVMPQTREHLAIMELLEVEKGVIAISKADLVEAEWLELVREDIRDQLAESFMAEAPMVTVSGEEETGLDELREKLLQAAREVPAKDDGGNIYLPVDRVFTLTGHGTIVTGTLIRGTLNKDEEVMIYPRGKEARVRSMQVHNQSRSAVKPGERVGVNLAGVDKDEVDRGDVLATAGSLQRTSQVDARLNLLPSAPLVVEHGTRIRFHIGANEVIGRVYLIDQEELYPGESGLVQYRLEDEIVARHLESYVVRRYSPMTTIGGGRVIEDKPPRRRRFDEEAIKELEIKESGTPQERTLLHLQLEQRPMDLQELIQKTGFSRQHLQEILPELADSGEVIELSRYQSSRWLASSVEEEMEEETVEIIEEYHREYPLRRGIGREELRSQLSFEVNSNELREITEHMSDEDLLKIEEEYISLFEFEVEFSGEAEEIREEILREFDDNPYTPPDINEIKDELDEFDAHLVEEVLRSLEERDELVRLNEEVYLSADSVRKARERLVEYLQENESIELAEFRDMLESTRKYTLPLLEYFDQQEVTERRGDERYLK